MRLDGGRLKEIQVRLFLSSRAEMQEVIETARQTTISLMQMQRAPTIVAPTIPPPTIPTPSILTPQSPPQTNLAAATILQQKIQTTLPVPLPGLITQQMYQQQLQQLQQQQQQQQQVNTISPTFEFSIQTVTLEICVMTTREFLTIFYSKHQ